MRREVGSEAWPWLALGVLGLIACAAAAWQQLADVLQAYLLAWLFFLGLTLGSLGALMLYELTGGRWGQPVKDRFKAALAPLPLLVLLFIPLIIGMSHLFPWAQGPHPNAAGAEDKSWYLNKDFFGIRAAFILAIWLVLAWWWRHARHRTAACSVGLIIYFVSMTVAAVDWIGSLEPKWSSTALGLIVVTGQGLGAFAFAVLTTAFVRPSRGLTQTQCGDLGNLLLTFLMTWMYLAFMQFLIIWAEDLPRETVWYLPRLQTSWRYLAIVLVVAEFALPFALLLSRSLKRDPRTLAFIAALMLFAHWLNVGWYVMPSLHPTGFAFHWVDLAATVGIGGLWMAGWTRRAEQLEVADGTAR
jgi:hypothetical protein